MLAASGAVQIYFLAATQIASFWPSGIAWLDYAERVMQLPLGLMAALGSSLLAAHSPGAIGPARRRPSPPRRTGRSKQPSALPAGRRRPLDPARPMSAALFERGAFESSDAEGTALVLAALGLGLPFATVAKVLSQSPVRLRFLARGAHGHRRRPCPTVAAALALAWPLGPPGSRSGSASAVSAMRARW